MSVLQKILDEHLIPDLANIVFEYALETRVRNYVYPDRKEIYTFIGDVYHGLYQYYVNNKLMKECSYKYGLLHGEYKLFHHNESAYDNGLTMYGNFIDGKMHGKFTFTKYQERYPYFGYSIVTHKVICEYKEDVLHGEYVAHDKNQIRTVCNFVNGKLHGIYKDFTHYRTVVEYIYENGILNGDFVQTRYDKIIAKASYANNVLHGDVIEYYENGSIKSKKTYLNGLLNGDSITYHDNGQLSSKKSYQNGALNGDVIEYHKNGQIQSKKSYIDGKLHGEFIIIDRNGQVLSREIYEHDALTGLYFTRIGNFNADYEMGHYHNNKKQCIVQIYKEETSYECYTLALEFDVNRQKF